MSLALRGRVLTMVLVCFILGAFASSAWGATGKRVFHPRVRNALGLIPPVNSQGDFNTLPTEEGTLTPVTYHGGSVMTGGVTVHTIFWAPPGFKFQGSPGGATPTYKGMIEKFYTDVSAASGVTSKCDTETNPCNIFTTLPQFAEGTAPGEVSAGEYEIEYEPADSIMDTEPYPAPAEQCVSPQNAKACISDEQVQEQVNEVIEEEGGERGLNNLWFVFFRPTSTSASKPECAARTRSRATTRSHTWVPEAPKRPSTRSRSTRSSRWARSRRAPTPRGTPTPRSP